jgi:hypothetical protein
MSLKALADKVLRRDNFGTEGGTDSDILSHGNEKETRRAGTVIPFPLTQDTIDNYQERAAIMEFDAGLSRLEAEAAAFKDCNVIWLNRRPNAER